MSTKKFTIIELIAALAVFGIILVIVMNFFVQAQNIRRYTEGVSRVQANARLIFDTIENDLLHAVASKEFGREIPFAMIDGPNGFGPFPLMVASLADDAAANYSSLAEVTYKIDTTTINGQEMTDIDENPVSFFKRSVTTDDQGKDTSWNFYGIKSKTGSANDWQDSGSTFQAIAAGIIDIKCMARIPLPTAKDYESVVQGSKGAFGGTYVVMDEGIMNISQNYNNLPTCLDVEVTLFDPKTEAADKAIKTKKTFFKRIFIKQGPRNYDIK